LYIRNFIIRRIKNEEVNCLAYWSGNWDYYMEEIKMDKLKTGDGPFIGSNAEIIRKLFGKAVEPNIHGGYEIKENKWIKINLIDVLMNYQEVSVKL
jgi:hypothetical protein